MKKVLVVVDMQNDFVDGALGTKEAVLIIDNVVNKIQSFDGDIYVTYDTHTKDYLNTSEGAKLPVIHCVKDTPGWKLNDKVQEALDKKANYKVYEKPTFGSVKLAEDLNKLNENEGISEITFIGLCTGICVISNAMIAKAYMPEVPINIDASCCACVTPDSHKTALDAMQLCQMNIINN